MAGGSSGSGDVGMTRAVRLNDVAADAGVAGYRIEHPQWLGPGPRGKTVVREFRGSATRLRYATNAQVQAVASSVSG